MTSNQMYAIDRADAYLKTAGLPTYTDLAENLQCLLADEIERHLPEFDGATLETMQARLAQIEAAGEEPRRKAA